MDSTVHKLYDTYQQNRYNGEGVNDQIIWRKVLVHNNFSKRT